MIPMPWENDTTQKQRAQEIYDYLNNHSDHYFCLIKSENKLVIGIKDAERGLIDIYECIVTDQQTSVVQDDNEYNIYTCQCHVCTENYEQEN